MKKFVFTLASMLAIVLVTSLTGRCQQCNPFTGLCFRSNSESQSLVSFESQNVPMEPAPIESDVPVQGGPMLADEANTKATVNRRFYSGRSCSPVRSLLVGTSQRIKRLRCR